MNINVELMISTKHIVSSKAGKLRKIAELQDVRRLDIAEKL